MIKTQLKDNSARLKREKTAIVGDVKPMIDVLTKSDDKAMKKSVSFNLKNVTKKASQSSSPSEASILSKKEQRETNLERENSKAIQKQSIRFKKAYVFYYCRHFSSVFYFL